MATKKPAAKAATAAKPAGKALTTLKEEMLRRARIATAQEASTSIGGAYFTTKGGILAFDGAPVPGNKMNVIVLDSVLENAYYTERYDSDNPANPACFAIGRNDKELEPHEMAEDKQCGACSDCEWNKMGSAENGKGKACKNLRRLLLLPEDALEDLENAQVAILKVPVTSGKHWAKYVKRLDANELAPVGVLTEISLTPHQKFQFEMHFKMVEELDEEHLESLFSKADENETTLTTPYTPREEQAEPTPRRGAGKATRAPAKPAKGRGGRR